MTYADTFGFQWNRFRATQLDSHSGLTVSRDRFFRQTGWMPDDLKGRLVLDVGCGAGRFAEIALGCGAEVVAVDYSSAVRACRDNLGAQRRLRVVQADVYELPFSPAKFDFVYCFGVLQHTPDVRSALLALPPLLRSGGRIAVDVYPRRLRNALWAKYWLRPVTKRLPPDRLLRAVERWVPPLLKVSGSLPAGARRVLPVADYRGVYPLSREQRREWAVLDTFDMLAPAHDHPQSPRTLRAWCAEAGLRQVEVFEAGVVVVGRGVRE